MDIFVEQLVAKKKTAAHYFLLVGCVLLAMILLPLTPILLSYIPGLASFSILIYAGLVYLLYLLVVGNNLEYEYCFVNGSMDVDKIINRKKRKRMTTLNARTIEKMGSVKSFDFERLSKDPGVKKHYACADKKGEDTYFVLYDGEQGRQMLVFTPNEKIKVGFKRYNPQKVYFND